MKNDLGWSLEIGMEQSKTGKDRKQGDKVRGPLQPCNCKMGSHSVIAL